MAVTELDVRRIAELARLSLAEPDLPAITAQLNNILSHMDVLEQVDTSSVEPVTGIGADGMPLRGDAVAPYPMNTTAPLLAPESRDGFILVPRLATHEEL
ncbi:MAG: Asp-tRNA(Asn)/Glu-tRNA(Gln) amidotransferase subunit GatC [Gemmatimonadota bacterium]|nr:Asp-tRNA(Asn)/Glu-tRNA(Gln) amidotransferase subunit GatC [Gemmatimonadota bacterium]